MYLVDVVRFWSRASVYRPSGQHDFAEGYDGVASVVTVELEPAHAPLPASRAVVKNLCGRFLRYVEPLVSHTPVVQRQSTCFGKYDNVYHVHGSVSIHKGVGHFRGCAGHGSVVSLSEDLFLEPPPFEVHMGVVKACLGRCVCTLPGCYLETAASRRFKCVKAVSRVTESVQAVRLRVQRLDPDEFPGLEGPLAPTSLDVSVTKRGVAVLRFSWASCKWTPEAEAEVLRFSDALCERLLECC